MNRHVAHLSSRVLRTVLWAVVGVAVLAAAPWALAVGALLAVTALLWWSVDRVARTRRPRPAITIEPALTA